MHLRTSLVLCLVVVGPIASAADTVVAASGLVPEYVVDRTPVIVDRYLTVTGPVVPTTMRVTVATGFVAGDTLDCDISVVPGATAFYDAPIGILTLTGPTTVADWRTLMRAVTFSTSDYGSFARTIVFSVGDLVAGTNGHFYEYVPGSVAWTAARADAATRSCFGAAGYLATIANQDENDLIAGKLNNVAWIGASDEFSAVNAAAGTALFADQSAAEGHWHWVTGPEAGTNFSNGDVSPSIVAGQYAHWDTTEPNNDAPGEHYASMLIGAGTGGWWNDLPDTGLVAGYVVEYGDLTANDLVGYATSVELTVLPDRLPVAEHQALTTPEDTDVVVVLHGTDPDGDPLTYSVTPTGSPGTIYQYNAGARGAAITAANTPVTDPSHRVIYAPPAESSGSLVGLFYFKVDDGTLVDLNYIEIAVTAVNDPPAWTIGGAAFTGTEHRASTSGAVEDLGTSVIRLADPDVGSSALQVVLSADHGRLTLPITGLDFAFTADADGAPIGAGGTGSTLCFRATLADLNGALASLTVTPDAGYAGSAYVTFSANDRGQSGGGGARSGSAVYRLDVAAVPPAVVPAAPAAIDHDDDPWIERATGCGAGSHLALLVGLAGWLYLRRWR